MTMANTADRYGTAAKFFHWLIVVLVIAQFIMGFTAEELPQGIQKLVLMTRHKQVGVTIFALVILRILWRLYSRPPALLNAVAWERWLARLTHFLLYGLILVMPVVGWFASSAGNHPVSYFGLFTLPDLVTPSEELEGVFEEIHKILAWTLLATASVHTLAALWHHFVRRDNVMLRMLPFGRLRGDS